MGKEKPAYFYLALTILLWSAVPAVAKFALAELDSFQVLFYNSIIGMISISAAILIQKKQRHLSKYTASDYAKMFGMGFLGLYLYYVLFYGSLMLAPAGQANMINYLWPIFVVIFSILLLKEKFTRRTFLAIFASFLGALLVFSRGDFSSLQNEYTGGYLLALGGAVCYGLFSVLGKKLQYEKFTSMLVFYAASLLLITPTMLAFSRLAIPQSATTWLALLFLGGLSSSLGFVFWFKALERGDTHKLANLIYVNPFLSLLFVYLLNNEAIPLVSVIGLLLIVGGIFVQLRLSKK